MAEFESVQSGAESEIRVALDGPYMVANIREFRDWLGENIAQKPEMELCRCGQSANKPFCDGGHTNAKFSGAKDPITDKPEVVLD